PAEHDALVRRRGRRTVRDLDGRRADRPRHDPLSARRGRASARRRCRAGRAVAAPGVLPLFALAARSPSCLGQPALGMKPKAWHARGRNRPSARAATSLATSLRGRGSLLPRPLYSQDLACPRHESNMRTRFRKPLLYPLSYGGDASLCPTMCPNILASSRSVFLTEQLRRLSIERWVVAKSGDRAGSASRLVRRPRARAAFPTALGAWDEIDDAALHWALEHAGSPAAVTKTRTA